MVDAAHSNFIWRFARSFAEDEYLLFFKMQRLKINCTLFALSSSRAVEYGGMGDWLWYRAALGSRGIYILNEYALITYSGKKFAKAFWCQLLIAHYPLFLKGEGCVK